MLGVAVAALALAAQPTRAEELGPMQRLARDLGTPKLGYTARNDAHTNSLLEFVRSSETVDTWTKMYTVVATSVAEDRTAAETKATIERLRRTLSKKHVRIGAYDVRDQAPPVAYFKYTVEDEVDVGVVFSPIPGVVTIQQVAARHGGTIAPHDIKLIQDLVGYPH